MDLGTLERFGNARGSRTGTIEVYNDIQQAAKDRGHIMEVIHYVF